MADPKSLLANKARQVESFIIRRSQRGGTLEVPIRCVTCCVSEDLMASLRCLYNETVCWRLDNQFEITASCGWRQKGAGGHGGDESRGGMRGA